MVQMTLNDSIDYEVRFERSGIYTHCIRRGNTYYKGRAYTWNKLEWYIGMIYWNDLNTRINSCKRMYKFTQK